MEAMRCQCIPSHSEVLTLVLLYMHNGHSLGPGLSTEASFVRIGVLVNVHDTHKHRLIDGTKTSLTKTGMQERPCRVSITISTLKLLNTQQHTRTCTRHADKEA